MPKTSIYTIGGVTCLEVLVDLEVECVGVGDVPSRWTEMPRLVGGLSVEGGVAITND